jgi:hypothetical protein
VVTYSCVLIVGCRRLVSAAWSSWTLRIYSSLPFSLASGLPKCDVFTLWTLSCSTKPFKCDPESPCYIRCYIVTKTKPRDTSQHVTILHPSRVTCSVHVTLRPSAHHGCPGPVDERWLGFPAATPSRRTRKERATMLPGRTYQVEGSTN